jgi:GH43 family beta-xylosidase
MNSLICRLCALLLLVAISSSNALAAFNNPILNGADPFVTKVNADYHMLATTDAASISIFSSPRLESVASNGKVIYKPTNGLTEIWSPTMFNMNGSWWIYFTAKYAGQGHGVFVLQSNTADPRGAYTFRGQIALGRDAIDPSILVLNNKTYLMYVGLTGYNGVWITELANPTIPTGANRLLIYPDQSWEKGAGTTYNYPVSEGPTALYRNGKTFIVYSGSDTGTYVYCLGLLTYKGSGDPTLYNNWVKTGPVLSYNTANGVYGPGRGTFTKSPDGTQGWIVYHAKDTNAYTYGNRTIRTQAFGWNADGSPNFGVPVSTNAMVQPPSGEPNVRGTIVGQNNVCVDVSGASTADGTPILIYTCNGNNAQQWRTSSAMELRNPLANKCLALGNGGAAVDGAPVWEWTCGNPDQKWRLNNMEVVAGNSGKCLDVPNSNFVNGQALQLYTCNGSAAQKFSYMPATSELRIAGAANKCVDVSASNPNNGTVVQVWDCNGGNAQKWVQGNGGFRTALNTNRCMDINANSTANGAKIQIWDCFANGPAQQFALRGQIENDQGKCLDIPSGNAIIGQKLQLYSCNGQAPQRWTYWQPN